MSFTLCMHTEDGHGCPSTLLLEHFVFMCVQARTRGLGVIIFLGEGKSGMYDPPLPLNEIGTHLAECAGCRRCSQRQAPIFDSVDHVIRETLSLTYRIILVRCRRLPKLSVSMGVCPI